MNCIAGKIAVAKIIRAENWYFENFSLKNMNDQRATQIKSVLCIKEPLIAVEIASPLKNNINGILPPIIAIVINLSQSCFCSFWDFSSGRVMAANTKPTNPFFSAVRATGFMPAIIISLFKKFASQLIRAAKRANFIP